MLCADSARLQALTRPVHAHKHIRLHNFSKLLRDRQRFELQWDNADRSSPDGRVCVQRLERLGI